MVDDDTAIRTYSPFAVLGVLLVVGLIGLAGVFLLGTSNDTPTEVLKPEGPVISTTTSTTTSGVPTTGVPPTFPDGTPTPADIIEVEAEPGQVTYRYAVPADLVGVDTAKAVAPALVQPTADGAALQVAMACAVSAGSAPSQITVIEDPLEVRVTAVAIGLRLGDPCPALTSIGDVTVPLEEPIGARGLVITRAGSPLPD